MLTLAITGCFSQAARAHGAYWAMHLFADVRVMPVSIAALLTGILLGPSRPWGLLRYQWVLTKLIATSTAVGELRAATHVAARSLSQSLHLESEAVSPAGMADGCSRNNARRGLLLVRTVMAWRTAGFVVIDSRHTRLMRPAGLMAGIISLKLAWTPSWCSFRHAAVSASGHWGCSGCVW